MNEVVDRDLGWKDLLARVRALAGSAYVKVGLLADEDAGGLHEPGGKLTVAEIGAVMEFGTEDRKVPERSWLRSTFDKVQDEIEALARELVVRVVLDGKMTARHALGVLGAKFSADLKNAITQGPEIPPPNAPSTAARKEHAGKWNRRGKAQAAGQGVRTLVDTGRMVAAITWAVVFGGEGGGATVSSGPVKG